MKLREMIAGLSAVLLLAVSCGASACTASCDLGRLANTHEHAVSQGGMTHCSMPSMRQSPSASSAELQALGGCHHQACGEQPALPGTHDGAAARFIAYQAIARATTISASLFDKPAVAPESPPVRTAAFVSLQTQLRV